MKTILSYLQLRAETHREQLAFCDETQQRTFSEVLEASLRIGTALSRHGAEREPVAVFLPRSVRAVEAFFGVLWAGCHYIPLDAEMGELRLCSILEQVQPRFLIADDTTASVAAECGFTGQTLLVSDLLSIEPDPERLQAIQDRVLSTDAAYIVFTSGSTGAPKGVVGHHGAMLDYMEQLHSVLRPTETDIFGMQAPLYVDACLKEILCTLRVGACTQFVPKALFCAPLRLVEFLNEKRITVVCWVVPALTLISSLRVLDTLVPETLQTVAFGSEVFPPKQLRLWQSRVPARYINLYGPTECTGMSCYYEVDRTFSDGERIPIGRPFDNTEILLLDENDRPAAEGEICIRGVSLCHGYYKNPERTAEVFCQNPLNPNYPDRIYRTGDIGAYNERGELVFVTRKDNQIKRMGHRIELGETEAAVLALEGVTAACAVFHREKQQLVLCYCGDLERGELMQRLRGSVPDYLLPNRTVKLDTMPLLNNGKTDRRAVTELCFARKD